MNMISQSQYDGIVHYNKIDKKHSLIHNYLFIYLSRKNDLFTFVDPFYQNIFINFPDL